MNIVKLFSAIYHENVEEIRKVISENPETLTQIFKEENRFDHKMTNELYSLCNNDSSLSDPNYREENALLFASRLGKKDICKILIEEFSADINAKNVYGFNPLMNALTEQTNQNIDTALMFLECKEINLKHTNAGRYDAMGHFLRNWQHIYSGINPKLSINKVQEMIDAFLEKGFDINKPQGKSGETGFLLACGAHSWIVALYLISKGADYSVNNNYLNSDRNIYSILCSNEYLPPKAKEEILSIMEKIINELGSPYGEFKKPENLYVCPISGEIREFNQERYG